MCLKNISLWGEYNLNLLKILKIIRVISLILWFSFTLSAAKADDFTRCVENQLSALGFSISNIDENLESATQQAIDTLKQKFPEFEKLPRFNHEAFGSIWCKAIGDKLFLKNFWPSKNAPIEFYYADDISEYQKQQIEQAGRSAVDFIEKKLNIKFAGTMRIASANSIPPLADMVGEVLDWGNRERRIKRYQNQCKNRQMTGMSSSGILILCFDPKMANFAEWDAYALKRIKQVLAHELSHEAHSQLSGNYLTAPNDIAKNIRGARWLVEALPLVIDITFSQPNITLQEQIRIWKEKEDYSGKQLEKYAPINAPNDFKFRRYATLAGLLLINKTSFETIGRYYQDIPTIGWEKAFEKNFGLTVENFYARFPNV